jgi:hypothetical protein
MRPFFHVQQESIVRDKILRSKAQESKLAISPHVADITLPFESSHTVITQFSTGDRGLSQKNLTAFHGHRLCQAASGGSSPVQPGFGDAAAFAVDLGVGQGNLRLDLSVTPKQPSEKFRPFSPDSTLLMSRAASPSTRADWQSFPKLQTNRAGKGSVSPIPSCWKPSSSTPRNKSHVLVGRSGFAAESIPITASNLHRRAH